MSRELTAAQEETLTSARGGSPPLMAGSGDTPPRGGVPARTHHIGFILRYFCGVSPYFDLKRREK